MDANDDSNPTQKYEKNLSPTPFFSFSPFSR